MCRRISMVVGFTLFVFLASVAGEAAPSRTLTEGERQIAQSNNAFGFDLFGKAAAGQASSANLAISPHSIATALAMTCNGADGDTREAMRRVLNLEGISTAEVNRSCRGLNRYLNKLDADVTLASAYSIWVDDNFELASLFKETTEEYFDATAASLAFDNPGSAKVINRWVEQNTGGMVSDIVDEIPSAAVAYLVNAIYFHGEWKYRFDVARTQAAPFTLADGSEIRCQMMSSGRLELPYLDESEFGFEAVELPYGDGAHAATIILPRPGRDLAALIATMNATNWNRWTGSLRTAELFLQLPKFKLECDLQLNDDLASMGMSVAFDSRRADFSKMSQPGTKDLWINRVIHKAVIDVTEKGTEAGAGTVVELKKGPPVKSLVVDRPFLFVIREINSGAVVFLARVAEPLN